MYGVRFVRFIEFLAGQLRRALAPVLAITIAVSTGGCSFLGAELNNRGGYLDAKLDDYWLIADTKQMRIMRAYVLIGSITRLAQTKYQSERELIIQHVNTSISVASDAYYCAYSQPGRCVYFDERMVELEVSVLRLLVAVLSNKDDEDIFEGLSKQLSATFPLLKAVDSLTKLVETVTTTGEAAVNAAKVIQALLKVGQSAYIKGRRVGALYRDSIELQMVTVVSSLDAMCAIRQQHFVGYSNTTLAPNLARSQRYKHSPLTPDEEWAVDNFYGNPSDWPDPCPTFRRGLAEWQRGTGDLKIWRDFLNNDAAVFRRWVMPNENAFMQASDLIWRSCEHLTKDPDELSDCIGRRKLKPGSASSGRAVECAVDFDRAPAAAEAAVEAVAKEEKVKKANSKAVNLPWHDQCRLILYAKTVGLRQNRRSRADARLYWLSELTPSPSHPIQNRPLSPH